MIKENYSFVYEEQTYKKVLDRDTSLALTLLNSPISRIGNVRTRFVVYQRQNDKMLPLEDPEEKGSKDKDYIL